MALVRWLAAVIAILRCMYVTGTCPAECNCKSTNTGKVAANCADGGLSSIPQADSSVNYLNVFGSDTHVNNIPVMRKDDMRGATNLISLAVVQSKVRSIEVGIFDGHSSIRSLSLAYNDIQSLTADTFRGLTNLRTLDISGNKNCVFDRTMFTHITNIEELNIGEMGFKKIPADLLSGLTKLKVLKLHMNHLKKLDENLILNLPALETLDLNGNMLRGIPAELKTKFLTMKSVHLSENPLQCNCQLLWLRDLPQHFYSSISDASTVVCNGPNKLRFQSFVNVPEKDFICVPPKVVKCEQTSYSLDINNKLLVSCDFEGDPIPEIKWTRPDGFEIDGRETTKNEYEIYENGTLVIDAVTLQDDGDWKVTAYNKTTDDTMTLHVHVIISTTSTSTTSTTTNPTTTTKSTTSTSTTSKATTTTPSPSRSSTLKTTTKLSVILSSSTRTSTKAAAKQTTKTNSKQSTKSSVTVKTSAAPIHDDDEKVIIKDGGINWGLLVAAAAGGGTVVGVICIIAMCCCKKKDANQVEPFEFDDYK